MILLFCPHLAKLPTPSVVVTSATVDSHPSTNTRCFVTILTFDWKNWAQSTKEQNAQAAKEWTEALDNKSRLTIEQSTGTRWSQVHRLSYFNLL
ncbi:hypothetical protein VTP01DRAFT_785 [Rhizomucor pusillus]|uniref:uncharacterized protein n=1 Tax=Rhizomucor pusillus TaxID=4840 RepID=UPI00374413B0